VDVQRIAAQFGGGGHPNAAGCTIAAPIAEATRVVLVAVRAALAAASEAPGAGRSET
jgi:phosphoesterase RecJ-like protein